MRLVNAAFVLIVAFSALRSAARHVFAPSDSWTALGSALTSAIPFFLAWRGLDDQASTDFTNAARIVNSGSTAPGQAAPTLSSTRSPRDSASSRFPLCFVVYCLKRTAFLPPQAGFAKGGAPICRLDCGRANPGWARVHYKCG
jgi:hypothetical protein